MVADVAVVADAVAVASVLRASVCDCLSISLFCACLWHDYLRHGNQLTDGFPFFPRFRRVLPREPILGFERVESVGEKSNTTCRVPQWLFVALSGSNKVLFSTAVACCCYVSFCLLVLPRLGSHHFREPDSR